WFLRILSLKFNPWRWGRTGPHGCSATRKPFAASARQFWNESSRLRNRTRGDNGHPTRPALMRERSLRSALCTAHSAAADASLRIGTSAAALRPLARSNRRGEQSRKALSGGHGCHFDAEPEIVSQRPGD